MKLNLELLMVALGTQLACSGISLDDEPPAAPATSGHGTDDTSTSDGSTSDGSTSAEADERCSCFAQDEFMPVKSVCQPGSGWTIELLRDSDDPTAIDLEVMTDEEIFHWSQFTNYLRTLSYGRYTYTLNDPDSAAFETYTVIVSDTGEPWRLTIEGDASGTGDTYSAAELLGLDVNALWLCNHEPWVDTMWQCVHGFVVDAPVVATCGEPFVAEAVDG